MVPAPRWAGACGEQPTDDDRDPETGCFWSFHFPCVLPTDDGRWMIVVVAPDGHEREMAGYRYRHRRAAEMKARDFTDSNPQHGADYQQQFGTPLAVVGTRFEVRGVTP